jgi:hypothetical protein
MTSLAVQAQAATTVAAVPTPACIQSRRAPVCQVPAAGQAPMAVAPVTVGDAGPRRGTARQLLDAALAGVRLGSRDRQFLTRLVHWDKRNAASVASLLERAQEAGREAGRAEAGLTARQLEVVVAALGDAAVYRASGAAAASCWDCELVPGGRCADHARDFDRASAYADLASTLSAPAPRDITDFRRRAAVASESVTPEPAAS